MWQAKDKTPYQVLGIREQATAAEIKAAHRALAAQYHPDREGGDADKMATINVAYDVLSDLRTKQDYDTYYRPKCPRCGGTRSIWGMQGFKRVKKRCPDCA